MYQQFYNLSAEPFRLSPDHNFAYSHKGYNKAWAYMEYAFMRAEGFVMITGRPGTGKTTLIGSLVSRLASAQVTIANLVCTQLQADDLLKMVAYEFGIPVTVVEKGELLQHLTQQLRLWHRDGRRALLIVDEAQDLSISAMEELRLLTNIQVDSRPLLQIFLLGQPELRNLILSPRLEQVHQRIIAASHIKPLEMHETEAYIRHRLETVHWRGDPAISKAVYPLIYKFSDGVPRRINLICSRLLLHGSVEQKHQITVADVREVIRELQSEHLAIGGRFSESDFQVKDVFDEVLPEARVAGNNPTKALNQLELSGKQPAPEEKLSEPEGQAEVVFKKVVLDDAVAGISSPEGQPKTASGAGRAAPAQNLPRKHSPHKHSPQKHKDKQAQASLPPQLKDKQAQTLVPQKPVAQKQTQKTVPEPVRRKPLSPWITEVMLLVIVTVITVVLLFYLGWI